MAQRKLRKRKDWSLEEITLLIHQRLDQSEAGLSYKDALFSLDLSSTKYFHLISDGLLDLIPEMHENELIKKVIEDKAKYEHFRDGVEDSTPPSDDNLYCKLFEMQPETVEYYYDLKVKENKTLPLGFLISPKNCYNLIKNTLETNIKEFKEASRKEQIQLIYDKIIGYKSEKGNGAQQWFHDAKLGGLLIKGPFRKKSSPVSVLQWFDERYSKERGWSSWFDLEQEHHIHFWDFSEKGLWDDEGNVYIALKHTLEENLEGFNNASREEQIKLIYDKIISYKSEKSKWNGAVQWFRDLKLRGLLSYGPFRKTNSPVSALQWFDKLYSEKTGQASWFDDSQDVYFVENKNHRLSVVYKNGS